MLLIDAPYNLSQPGNLDVSGKQTCVNPDPLQIQYQMSGMRRGCNNIGKLVETDLKQVYTCTLIKILTIQHGYPRGVSSIGKPRPTSIGISSVSIYRVYIGEWSIKSLLTGQVHVYVDVG